MLGHIIIISLGLSRSQKWLADSYSATSITLFTALNCKCKVVHLAIVVKICELSNRLSDMLNIGDFSCWIRICRRFCSASEFRPILIFLAIFHWDRAAVKNDLQDLEKHLIINMMLNFLSTKKVNYSNKQ